MIYTEEEGRHDARMICPLGDASTCAERIRSPPRSHVDRQAATKKTAVAFFQPLVLHRRNPLIPHVERQAAMRKNTATFKQPDELKKNVLLCRTLAQTLWSPLLRLGICSGTRTDVAEGDSLNLQPKPCRSLLCSVLTAHLVDAISASSSKVWRETFVALLNHFPRSTSLIFLLAKLSKVLDAIWMPSFDVRQIGAPTTNVRDRRGHRAIED